MTISRSAVGWRSDAAALLLLISACAMTGGVAVRGSAGPTTGMTIPTTAPTGAAPPGSMPATTPPEQTSATPVPPPACSGTIEHLSTPTGTPVITVSAAANFFLANSAVEPLSIAVYADGTAISSLGVGAATRPLPRMTIGYVRTCTLEWAEKEIEQLANADLGRPNVTDQGTTDVVYRRTDGLPVPSRHTRSESTTST